MRKFICLLTLGMTMTTAPALSADDTQDGASSGKVQVVFESNLDLQVPDLHCDKGGCCPTVGGALAETDGVNNVDVNVKEKSARVTFDPSKVTQEAILAALKKAGIKASKAPADKSDDKKKDASSDKSS